MENEMTGRVMKCPSGLHPNDSLISAKRHHAWQQRSGTLTSTAISTLVSLSQLVNLNDPAALPTPATESK